MTAQEKKLSVIVGTLALVIVNYLLIEFFIKHESELRAEFIRKTVLLKEKRKLMEEKEGWEKFNAWVQSNQPVASEGAGVALLEQVKQVAQARSVQLSDQSMVKPVPGEVYTSVVLRFDARGEWRSLCAFLRDLQGPSQFLVYDKADLKRDDLDKTQMHATFQLAKWFAPK